MTVVAEKMFHVLECIATDDKDVIGLARLTKRTEIPKATLYRLLCDLSRAGIVDHGPGGYSLGTRLFELGNGVPRYRRLRRAAHGPMEALNRSTGETVHLAVTQRSHVVILDKVHGQHRVRIPTAAGTQLPLHSTAVGKVALAFGSEEMTSKVLASRLRVFTRATVCATNVLERQLDAARISGWATAVEETIHGVGCVASPIVLDDGRLAGMLSLSGDPRNRTTPALVNQLCQAASEISNAMGDSLAEAV